MDAVPDMARVAKTMGDPTRIQMLTLLMDGRAATAKELAYGSGVTPATATAHLSRLLQDCLVTSRSQGRHKYFQITSEHVARCVESLMVIAQPVTRKSPTSTPHPLRQARLCYDHLAGVLGTELTAALLSRRILELDSGEYRMTPAGAAWLTRFGLDLTTLEKSRRKLAPACLDWSERKDHLGGALGAALAQLLLDKRWLKRKSETREITITPLGHERLARELGINF